MVPVLTDCPGCALPLTPARDAEALARAGRTSEVRLECRTSTCPEHGCRRTLREWEAAAHGVVRHRPTWDDQFVEMAFLVARRGTCDRSQVGCVLAVRNRVVATGYNGSLPGALHCSEAGHLMDGTSCVRTVHAEANAVADAARRGVSVEGGSAYLTRIPCVDCAKLIASAGIVRVVAAIAYRDPETVLWVFRAAGVALEWPGGGWKPDAPGGMVSARHAGGELDR